MTAEYKTKMNAEYLHLKYPGWLNDCECGFGGQLSLLEISTSSKRSICINRFSSTAHFGRF